MLLKTLELHNYRQHKHLIHNFDGNLIGVLGPNGSGKSHFMDALEFCFAGRVSGQNKSDMLNWGADDGYVKLTFEHRGQTGEIYREVNSSKATYRYGDETDVTGISNVNEAIAATTGLDADICKQAVFVHQKEVDAVLFTEPSARQLAWQRLCGLGDASTVHGKLGQFISGLPEVTDYTERIDEATERISKVSEELDEARENLAITDTSTLDLEMLNQRLQKAGDLNRSIQNGVSASKLLNVEKQKLSTCEQELEEKENQLNNLPPESDVESLTAQYNQALSSLAAMEKAAAIQQSIAQLETEQQAIQCPYTDGDLSRAEKAWNDANENASSAATAYKLQEQLMLAISGKAETTACPLCTQPVSGNLQSIAQESYERAKDTLEVSNQAKEAAESHYWEVKTALTEHHNKVQAVEQQLSGFRAQLETVKQSIEVETTKEQAVDLQTRVDQAKRNNQMRQGLLSSIAASKQLKASLQESVQQKYNEVESLLNESQQLMQDLNLNNPQQVGDKASELQGKVKQAQESREEAARLNGVVKTLENSLDNLKESVKELEERDAKQAALRGVVGTLQRVREWFHYEHGPRAVINSLLERITSGVNDFLEKFGAPFYAIPDYENTSFRYCYTDGRVLPDEGYPSVSEMSGGEAVVLAVSFRFATYCLFAGRIGLLTLDEPTVYLDENNIGCFCNLLERVKELAADMNLQILISTHERVVIPFMDNTIKFGTYKTEEDTNESERNEEAA